MINCLIINNSLQPYAESDPCPLDWRVPTREELESLANATNIWTALNGVSGRLFIDTAANQIFCQQQGHAMLTVRATAKV